MMDALMLVTWQVSKVTHQVSVTQRLVDLVQLVALVLPVVSATLLVVSVIPLEDLATLPTLLIVTTTAALMLATWPARDTLPEALVTPPLAVLVLPVVSVQLEDLVTLLEDLGTLPTLRTATTMDVLMRATWPVTHQLADTLQVDLTTVRVRLANCQRLWSRMFP
jgi:hypothetical protein